MASTHSLNNGTQINDFFSIVKKIRKESEIPLVLMTYTNILYNQTYQKFIKRAATTVEKIVEVPLVVERLWRCQRVQI